MQFICSNWKFKLEEGTQKRERERESLGITGDLAGGRIRWGRAKDKRGFKRRIAVGVLMIIVIVVDTQRFESDGISEEAIGHGPVRFRAPRSIIIAVAVGCICCFFFHCLLALDLRVLCVINEFWVFMATGKTLIKL